MSVRINARLGAERASKFEHLKARTGKSATEILSAAIDVYFAQVVGPLGRHALLDDYIACASGDADLSEQYKRQLAHSLASKTRTQVKVGRATKAALPGKVTRGRKRAVGS